MFIKILPGYGQAEKESGMDTSSILRLIEKAMGLTDKSPDQALQYLDEALKKSAKTGFDKGVALASIKMGKWYFGSNNDKSIQLARIALDKFEKNTWGTVEHKAEAHLLLAESYDEKGQTDSSAYFYYLLGSEMEAGNINDPEFAVAVFTKLTIFWVNLDYGSVSNKEYLKTIRRFVEKANAAAKKITDQEDGRSSVYFIQGAYYHGIRQFDSARYFYKRYIDERERLKKLGVQRKISTLFNIADTYLQQDEPDEAMKYISEIKEIGKDPAKTKYLAFYITFIDFLTAKALYQQKQYAAAIALLSRTHEELKKTGSHFRNEIVESYKISADSYEAMGNYKKALEQKNIYLELYDSLSKKDKIDMISRLEVRYGIAEKDKELALQKLTLTEVNNSNRNKNFLLAGISLFAFLIVVIFALWRNRNVSTQKLQLQKIDNLQQKIKIERLNASIAGEQKERTRMARELHDGIGGLISAAKMNFELARKKIPQESAGDFTDGLKLLEEAGIELRQAAHNLIPETLLQEGLSAAVAAYCERLSSKGTTTISFQSFGEQQHIGPSYDLTIYRIIQELVHNIIKHARAKTAMVQLNFHPDNSLSITVEDDGIGMKQDGDHADGMGLKNIHNRVKELNGSLEIKSETGKGTGFYLEFQPENFETA
ncbi:ATP-binding protein [Ferruginibacter sp. HRS2-29]|uniref:tetratricopeptide repeat-containing sensor histidine kinase n=1 Tax=Ferruginibacter sp. HRS2-29 TaxID=2487334 RepID=UPI0020CB79C1|nr:ATP-binding protein [Ferruginibacter sp. HRS2-29]